MILRALAPLVVSMIAPVVCLAFSFEARKTYAAAWSSGGLSLASVAGVRARSCSYPKAARPRKSVRVPPGATPFTRIFGASSHASWRISPTIACFDAV